MTIQTEVQEKIDVERSEARMLEFAVVSQCFGIQLILCSL